MRRPPASTCPASRLEPALELLAEVARRPDVPRVGGRAPARRAAQRPAPGEGRPAPARRGGVRRRRSTPRLAVPPPAGGTQRTVATLDPAALRAVYERALDPGPRRRSSSAATSTGIEVPAIAERLFGDWPPRDRRPAAGRDRRPAGASTRAFVRVVHRPGAVQTEIRIGHPGLPRRIPDFHALSVMGAILGGLFNSRLNMKLREEKGYTYGASAGFDLRRAAGRSRRGPP